MSDGKGEIYRFVRHPTPVQPAAQVAEATAGLRGIAEGTEAQGEILIKPYVDNFNQLLAIILDKINKIN